MAEETKLDRYISKHVYPAIRSGELEADDVICSLSAALTVLFSKLPMPLAAGVMQATFDAIRVAERSARERRAEAGQSPDEQRTTKTPPQHEIHNRLAGKIIIGIVKGQLDAGGTSADVLVLLESIVAGVVSVVSSMEGSGVVFDVFADGCRERIAQLALGDRPAAGNA